MPMSGQKAKLQKRGDLSFLEADTNPEAPLLGILFHGYGADAFDLRSLSEVLTSKKEIHWVFPQGILDVPIGPGWTGRAWWPVDIEALQKAAMSGQAKDLSDTTPATLPAVRAKAQKFIESFGIPWNRIVLGGFSQGAMLATDLFLHAPENPAGLMIFSGALINKAEWRELAPRRKGCEYFICHGKQDMVLAHKGAAQLESLLNAGGMKGSLVSFEGSHEIPMLAIQKANSYLKR